MRRKRADICQSASGGVRPGKPVATSERRSQATDDRHSLLRQRTTSPWPGRPSTLWRARARAWFWIRSHSDKDRDLRIGNFAKNPSPLQLAWHSFRSMPGSMRHYSLAGHFFLHRMRWERTANLTRGCDNRCAAPSQTHFKMNRIGERDRRCRAYPQERTFKTN
jgi:hypothetical protein